MFVRAIVVWALVAAVQSVWCPQPALAGGLNVNPGTGTVEGSVPVNKVGSLLLADGQALLRGQQVEIVGTAPDSGQKVQLKGKLFKTQVTTSGHQARFSASCWFPQGASLCPEASPGQKEIVHLKDGSMKAGRIADITADAIKLDSAAGKSVIKLSEVSWVDSPRVVNIGIRMIASGEIAAGASFAADVDSVVMNPAWPAKPSAVQGVKEYLTLKELAKLADLGKFFKLCEDTTIKAGKEGNPYKTLPVKGDHQTASTGSKTGSGTQAAGGAGGSQSAGSGGTQPDVTKLSSAELREYVDVASAAAHQLGPGAIVDQEFIRGCLQELRRRGQGDSEETMSTSGSREGMSDYPAAQPDLNAGSKFDPIEQNLEAIRERLEQLKEENLAAIKARLEELDRQQTSGTGASEQGNVPGADELLEIVVTAPRAEPKIEIGPTPQPVTDVLPPSRQLDPNNVKDLTDAQLKEFIDISEAAASDLGSGAVQNAEFIKQCRDELKRRQQNSARGLDQRVEVDSPISTVPTDPPVSDTLPQTFLAPPTAVAPRVSYYAGAGGGGAGGVRIQHSQSGQTSGGLNVQPPALNWPELPSLKIGEMIRSASDAELKEYLELSVGLGNWLGGGQTEDSFIEQVKQELGTRALKAQDPGKSTGQTTIQSQLQIIDSSLQNQLGVPFGVTGSGKFVRFNFSSPEKMCIDSPPAQPASGATQGTQPASGQTIGSAGTSGTVQEYVTYQLSGNNSTTQCSLNLTNLSSQPLWLFVPAYTVFTPDNAAYQNMMTVSSASMELPAAVDPVLNLATLCVSTKCEKPPPPEGVKFRIGPHPDAAARRLIVRIYEISQVLDAYGLYRKVPISPARRQSHIAQLAVWQALGQRSGSEKSAISKETIKSDLLEQSGVKLSQLPPERQKALDDFCRVIFTAVDTTVKLAELSIKAGL
jgi:hypothetical protein